MSVRSLFCAVVLALALPGWSLADSVPPALRAFDVKPRASNGGLTVTWRVTDSGGSHLERADVWRAAYNTNACHEADRRGCVWAVVQRVAAPAGSDSWSGRATDTPSPDGVYWYGIHVLDLAGNEITDAALSGPVKIIKLRAPTPETTPQVTKKALLLIYDPILSSGQRLHAAMGWQDPQALTARVIESLRHSSGSYLNQRLVQTVVRNEWPLKLDGFRYNEASYLRCIRSSNRAVDCHVPDDADYARVFSDFNLCHRLGTGELDEIIIYSAPYFGFDEFAFKIPGDAVPYGTPTNYWIYEGRKKNIPDCGKTVFIMGYSYERGLAEALESYAHRVESALALTVGRGFWDGCKGHPTRGPSDFDAFTCIDKDTAGAAVRVAGCGTAHFPPNGLSDYDDGNRAFVSNACSSWDNYPFAAPTVLSQNCTTWGCERTTFLQWWMSHIPNREGVSGNGNLRNWWKYIADFDRAVGTLERPDLQVTGVSFTTPPREGVPTLAVARLINVGRAESGTFNVKWFVDGTEGGYGAHQSLEPDEVSNGNVRFTWTPTAGRHELRFSADVDNYVRELSETNNSATGVTSVLADLEVSGITFTTAPAVGVSTTAVARLTNVGRARSGIFNVKWSLHGAQVGYGQHASLGQGEVSNGNVRFAWTPTTGGSHNLRFVADVDGQVTELRELNNQSSLTFNVEILADLVVTGISFTSPPRPGTPTTAVARLVNAGTAASPSFNVKWFLDGVQVGYGNHAALAPGEVSNGNVRFLWTPTTGTHSLRFAADVDSYVRETNEANNSASATVNVENLADLRVSRITFTSPPRAGVPTVAVAQLTNVGRAPSGYFNVKWFLDGAQVGYGGHTPLAPGEVSNGNVRLMWTPSAGTHTLRFAADVDGQVREYSETDNSASITIVVGQ